MWSRAGNPRYWYDYVCVDEVVVEVNYVFITVLRSFLKLTSLINDAL